MGFISNESAPTKHREDDKVAKFYWFITDLAWKQYSNTGPSAQPSFCPTDTLQYFSGSSESTLRIPLVLLRRAEWEGCEIQSATPEVDGRCHLLTGGNNESSQRLNANWMPAEIQENRLRMEGGKGSGVMGLVLPFLQPLAGYQTQAPRHPVNYN